MTIVSLILVFWGIIMLETPRLIKEKMWGELMAFSGLLLFGMVLSFAEALQIKLPNPTAMIEAIFGPPAKLLLSILK